jgi:geranylgeranyl diphosphate synthase type I
MKFKEFIDYNKRRIDQIIISELSSIKSSNHCLNNLEVYDKLLDFATRGGKRIRPLLLLYTHTTFSKKGLNNVAYKLAAYLELLHNFLLIHDDIMDQSETRRGKPTINKIYEKAYKSRERGNSKALVVGDLLLFAVYNKILQLPVKNAKDLLSTINHALTLTTEGQILDYDLTTKEFREDLLFRLHELKTSYYTINLPMKLGLMLIEKRFKDLEEFSKRLGIAFQLMDDELDLFSQKSGKDYGKDIKEGKITLLIHKALENSKKEDKQFLKSRLGNNPSKKEIDKIKEIIIKTGAKDYNSNTANNLFEEAIEIIRNSRLAITQKDNLMSIVDFLRQRKN